MTKAALGNRRGAEIRNPKAEGRKKSEIRNPNLHRKVLRKRGCSPRAQKKTRFSAFYAIFRGNFSASGLSDFGLLSSFGLRVSGFRGTPVISTFKTISGFAPLLPKRNI